MTRRRKKEINKELTAISSLRDSDIDTSDIPEITDWSEAFVGKFYRSPKIDTSRPASSDTAFTPRPLPVPIPDPQLSTGIAVAAMSHQQLVMECVQGGTEAWTEFVRRFQKVIAIVVMRTATRWGETSPEVIEDLVQDVYLKLTADDGRVLREFEPRDDSSFFGFLKVVAANVVNNHFRAAHSMKRGASSISDKTWETAPLESTDSAAKAEREILLGEIDRILEATTTSDRDRQIFRLYYHHGLSAEAIASIPQFGLSVKGTESAILRLTKLVRHELAKTAPARQSQRGTPAQALPDQESKGAREPKKKE